MICIAVGITKLLKLIQIVFNVGLNDAIGILNEWRNATIENIDKWITIAVKSDAVCAKNPY